MENQVEDPRVALATALADKHNSMTRVLFKVESLHGVLVSQQTKWLTEARKELEEAWEDALAPEPYFVEVLSQVAVSLGVSPESTLREVAAVAGEPWAFVFSQMREEILAAAQQIEQTSALNKSMLARGQIAIAAAMRVLGGEAAGTYDSSGGAVGGSRGVHTVDVRS